MTEAKHTWYYNVTSAEQGLVYSEQDGANIAVAYDAGDAPLIAAAPEMLEALEAALRVLENEPENAIYKDHTALVRTAIAKAKGE